MVSDAELFWSDALNSAPKENSGDPASSGALALLLAALAMLGPFSVDSYLPAFPAIQNNLGASALEVQQTLTVYMLSFSVMILWHGAVSDAVGECGNDDSPVSFNRSAIINKRNKYSQLRSLVRDHR